MLLNILLHKWKSPCRNGQQERSASCFCPRLEELESRLLLATDTWSGLGGLNVNWSNPLNWAAKAVPAAGDDLVFPDGSPNESNTNDIPDGTTFNSITFTTSPTSGGGYTMQGNAIVLLAGLTNDSIRLDTLNLKSITLGADQTFVSGITTLGGTLIVSSSVSLNGHTLDLEGTYTGEGGGFGTLGGTISGSGNINVNTTDFWSITGNNTYSGITTVIAGELEVESATGLGSAAHGTLTTVNSGAGLLFLLSGNTTVAESFSISGIGNGLTNGAIEVETITNLVTLTLSGSVTLNEDTLITGFNASFLGSNTLNFSGSVATGGHDLSFLGLTVVISANVQGPLNIQNGTTLVPGTLTSTGTTAPGILNTGPLTFSFGGTYEPTISGTMAGNGSTFYSRVVATGAVSLNGASLSVNFGPGFTPQANTGFDILQSTGAITGTFNNLPDGQTFLINGQPFVIRYVSSASTAGVEPNQFQGRVVICRGPLATVAMVTSSAPSGTTLQPVTLTVTVASSCLADAAVVGGINPSTFQVNLMASGNVIFYDTSTPIFDNSSPVSFTTILSAGVATLTPELTAGVHYLWAAFDGTISCVQYFIDTQSFVPVTITPAGVGWHDVLTGDFLGNGNQDIAGMTVSGQWWMAVSTGSRFINQLWGGWNPNVNWVDVHVGDFDGDGKMDIAGRFPQTGQWWVAQSTGSSFTNHLWTSWSPNANWVDVKVGDFNGDGKADIVGRYSLAGQWWVAQSTGSSFTNSLWASWNPNVDWVDVKVGKFAGSARSDLTGRWSEGGSWWTAISTGSSFNTSLWASWNPNVIWVDVKVADFNNDGKTDLTGRWLQGGAWWTAISTGSSFTTSLWASWNPNATWVDVQVGDFNGDGKADIAARYLQGGSWYAGISTNSSFSTDLWGDWNPAVNWVDVTSAEVDSDKLTDLVGRYSDTGQWWTAISNGSNAFANQLWTTWAP